MTLQKRLTIFTVTLTTAITVILGFILVESTYRAQIGSLDLEMSQISQATKSGEDSLITEALTLASASRNNLSLLVLDQNGELLPVLEQIEALSNTLEELLNRDKTFLKEISTVGNYRMRGIEIGGGDQLLIVADLADINNEKNRNYLLLVLFLLVSSLISISLLRKVINRDVNRAITEIKALDRLQAEQEKTQFLRHFMADASHELRTPLTVIKGYLELWKQDSNSLIAAERLEIMLAESKRMDKNITSLLTFLEQETISDEALSPINISNILQRELSIFAEQQANREIDVSIDSDLNVLGTNDLILTLLRNIFSNIARHSNSNSKVVVRAFKSEKDVILQFENEWSSQKFDSFDLEKLTTRFSSIRSFEKGGSGLGFSIMNGVVTKMQGKLGVYRNSYGDFGVMINLPNSAI